MIFKNNLITLKNKDTLIFDDFSFKCSIGKNGLSSDKFEGDKKTPKGIFKLGSLFYRKDRKKLIKIETKLNIKPILKNMAWCNDVRNKKYYNKQIKINKSTRYEILFRKDYKYDLFIPILYNSNRVTLGRGSAIFIHLTKNYVSTAGCIAINKKDFKILIKIINRNTKIEIF